MTEIRQAPRKQARKRVAMQLPRAADVANLAQRHALELEALAPIADIVEVASPSPDGFVEGASDCDAVITSWGFRLDESIVSRLDRCVVIGVGSVGVDMVDVEAATRAGIVVTNTPDVFIEEVADHTMMLLLSAIRRTKEQNILAAESQWFRGRPMLNHVPRLMGRTLGLVSFGNVARCTAVRAKAFGLNVIAYDPHVSELTIGEHGVEPVAWHELLERSDYISIHSPDNEETHHSLNADAFARMKDGVIVKRPDRGTRRQGPVGGSGRAGDGTTRPGQPPPHHAERDHHATCRLRLYPHEAHRTSSSRTRGHPGAARQVADELRESDRAAIDGSNAGSPTPWGAKPVRQVLAFA